MYVYIYTVRQFCDSAEPHTLLSTYLYVPIRSNLELSICLEFRLDSKASSLPWAWAVSEVSASSVKHGSVIHPLPCRGEMVRHRLLVKIIIVLLFYARYVVSFLVNCRGKMFRHRVQVNNYYCVFVLCSCVNVEGEW